MVLNYDTEIEILLFDQDRIVSYKELNNKFNISPTEARSLIQKFIATKRKTKNQEFHVTYLIIGEEIDTKHKKVFLTNEDELEKLNNFKILSKQVYSIQKNPISDFNLIYANDLDASLNTDRKSNLSVVERIPSDEMLELDSPNKSENRENQNPNQPKKTDSITDMAKLSLSKSSTENKPAAKLPAPAPIDTNKIAKEAPKEKAKEIVIKDEPMVEEAEAKKHKLTADKEPAKPAPAKTAKKDPPKTQKTLTNFFKKA